MFFFVNSILNKHEIKQISVAELIDYKAIDEGDFEVVILISRIKVHWKRINIIIIILIITSMS